MTHPDQTLYHPDAWHRAGQGPRYLQLSRHIGQAIEQGVLEQGQQLPPERDLADLADVSRVTVRKAVAELVSNGLVEQRRGAGSFVTDAQGAAAPRLQQSLSSLISFTENMKARGHVSSSRILSRGLFPATPDEMVSLGLSSHQRVARIDRLRSADGIPMAIERSSLPEDVLPDPDEVGTSLYEVLRRHGLAPSRAIQRVTATNVSGQNSEHLQLNDGTAVLQIDRTAYLSTGRPIEFTRGLYRSDMYDFVSELRTEDPT